MLVWVEMGRQSHWNACPVQQARGLALVEPQGECRRLPRVHEVASPSEYLYRGRTVLRVTVSIENRGAVRPKALVYTDRISVVESIVCSKR